MNYRKEYVWRNSGFGDKIMDICSYVPMLGLPLDNVINNRVEDYINTIHSEKGSLSEINKFREKSFVKDSYHTFVSLLISVFFLQKILSSESKNSSEKIEGPSSLENVLKVIGLNNPSKKTFNYEDYFV